VSHGRHTKPSPAATQEQELDLFLKYIAENGGNYDDITSAKLESLLDEISKNRACAEVYDKFDEKLERRNFIQLCTPHLGPGGSTTGAPPPPPPARAVASVAAGPSRLSGEACYAAVDMRIERDFGRKPRECGGAGNCFFHVLADKFLGNRDRHFVVRQRIARHIRDHSDEFREAWAPSGPTGPQILEQFCDALSHQGTYVDGGVEVKAACDVFHASITILGLDATHDRVCSGPGGAWRHAALVHYDTGDADSHYRILDVDVPGANGGQSDEPGRRDVRGGSKEGPPVTQGVDSDTNVDTSSPESEYPIRYGVSVVLRNFHGDDEKYNGLVGMVVDQFLGSPNRYRVALPGIDMKAVPEDNVQVMHRSLVRR